MLSSTVFVISQKEMVGPVYDKVEERQHAFPGEAPQPQQAPRYQLSLSFEFNTGSWKNKCLKAQVHMYIICSP